MLNGGNFGLMAGIISALKARLRVTAAIAVGHPLGAAFLRTNQATVLELEPLPRDGGISRSGTG
jgi:hypothetical protein